VRRKYRRDRSVKLSHFSESISSAHSRHATLSFAKTRSRARLESREASYYQSRSRISGSSQRSISMEWC